VFLQEHAHLVAMLGGISFLQVRKAEHLAKVLIVLDQRFAAQDVGGVLPEVAVGIVAV
jgi:hypothetical protein